jgi:hypothetical protein
MSDKPANLSWSQWRAAKSWEGVHRPIAWNGVLVSQRIYPLICAMSVAKAMETKWLNQWGVG